MPRRESNERRERRERIEAKGLEERRRVWKIPLGMGTMDVVVELDTSKTGCAHEMASKVRITVNEERSWEALLYHTCSQWPACGTPNQHCWREAGHDVELALDGTAFHVWKEAMVLFIDGREVETGLTRAQYWRRVFLKKLLVSSALILAGSLGIVLYFATSHSFVAMITVLMPFGLIYVILSMMAMLRYHHDPVEVSIQPVSRNMQDNEPLLCAEVETV